jgi:phenylacetate-CoA ligase
LGVPLVDMYSSQEVGYIALQCPEHEHYHVQSENVLVEILNADNEPCEPGEVGQVVITTLQNYAMPLIRYAILDYAEVGTACSCGRSLPVLNRVMGRQRNMLTLPNGKHTWPTFPVKSWGHIKAIRQMQLVQKTLEHIEVRLVADRPLGPNEESELAEILRQRFGHPFQVSFLYLDRIERGKNFKFEDFISEVAG